MTASATGSRAPVIRVIDCHICRCADPLTPWYGTREYLLLQRSQNRIYAGDWRMVGGKIEGSETAWQAALREVREETGLTVQKMYAAPYINQFYEPAHDRINAIPVFVALVDLTAQPELDSEHKQAQWFTVEEAVKHLPWPAQRDGLQAADNMLAMPNSLLDHLCVPDFR